jgi:DNA-binding transcriptional LysR family regulator
VAYVRNGLGVALLPRPALAKAEDVATLTIDDADLDWPFRPSARPVVRHVP